MKPQQQPVDLNLLQSRKQTIATEMSQLIDERNALRDQQERPESGLEALTSIRIQLVTTVDDKDPGSLLTMWVEKPGGTRIAECYVANTWLKPYDVANFQFVLLGTMTIQETFGARLYVRIDRQDAFQDSWYYTPTIKMEYTDGYTFEKEFGAMVLKQSQQDTFVL